MPYRTVVLLVTFALSVLGAPLISGAQQAAKVPRTGALLRGPPASTEQYIAAFRLGLRELGYVEGQNIALDLRWVEGQSEQFRDLAADLVRVKADIIFVWGTIAATAAQHATSTIPIVFVAIADPVEAGLVASLARPGRNITGLSNNLSAELSAKRLEMLKETVPALRVVAVLRNPDNLASTLQLRETQVAAQALGLQLHVVELREPQEFESAFSAMTQARADALLVLADTVFLSHRAQVAALAAKSRLPTIFNVRQYAEVGGLMAYGPSLVDLFRRAATYVDKILKGAKPVELPTKFELIINLKTAKALGMTIPPSLLLLADEVIR